MKDTLDQDLKTYIDDAVMTVFDTMLALEIQPSERGARFKTGEEQVVGMVGLAGAVTAVVCLRVTETLAIQLTEAMMGIKQEEATEGDVNDVIGELTNISAGKLKSCFRSGGKVQPCSLSLPTIVRGTSLDLESMSGTERHSYTFNHGDEPVVVEFYSLP